MFILVPLFTFNAYDANEVSAVPKKEEYYE